MVLLLADVNVSEKLFYRYYCIKSFCFEKLNFCSIIMVQEKCVGFKNASSRAKTYDVTKLNSFQCRLLLMTSNFVTVPE